MTRVLVIKLAAAFVLGSCLLPSAAIAQTPLLITPLAEKKVAELPAGELFWSIETFPALAQEQAAAGAIPVKYKELIAVAVAHRTQCPYCINIRGANARTAGATETEIVEAAMVAAALRAGAAVTHATHALAD